MAIKMTLRPCTGTTEQVKAMVTSIKQDRSFTIIEETNEKVIVKLYNMEVYKASNKGNDMWDIQYAASLFT